ncbi:MAG: GIY-YIG nuclease family protein [Cytophagaceae bacterium]
MFFVYILFSQKNQKYYIGSSQNLEERLFRHNSGHSTFTKTGIPWVLVYKESFATRAEAVQREKYIKSQKSTVNLQNLISHSSDG